MSKTASKVPMGKKIAFGLGMLANQMFPAALGIFMVVLVKDLGFPTWMWGILYFLPRIFDSITDPIMGYISDNTRSKWGRRRHYVFLGAIIMGISFALMWQLHREDTLDYNFWYYLIWSLVFYLGLTIFSVPYVAMGYEMSDDFHERTNIMAVAQWIGQWAWVLAPWLWVIMYDPSWFESGDVATRTLAIWVAIVCSILAMVPAIFIKDKSTLNDDNLEPLNLRGVGGSLKKILKGFQEAFKLEPFRKLCIATFLVFNAFNTVAAFSFFIIVYYLFNGDAGAAWIWPTLFGSVGALVTTFVVIPIVERMSKKIGKKQAFLVSQGISIIGYIMLWFLFIPGKPYMFLFALPFFSFGIGGLFTLMMSMTADVCDLDELNFGQRREGIFGAIYWWMVKFGFAIAGGLSALIMWAVDFTPDAATQPEGAVTGLRFFFSAFPILGTAIAMYVMRGYDLTEARAMEISAELQNRKAKKKSRQQSSAYGVGNLLSVINSDIKLEDYKEIDFTNKSVEQAQMLFREKLNAKLHGLCFSPYAEGQDIDDILTESQIRRRMNIISPYTKWIRSFSCTEGNELIPEIAHEKGLKSIVGAWISDDEVRNEREIETLIKLAKAGFVDIAAVGNEVLLRGDVSEDALIVYINRVKQALSDMDIPVGYVDTYFEYHKRPNLVAATDVILANCYPFWEGFSIDDSLQYLREMHAITKHFAKGKRIIITETGWPSQGAANDDAHPSQINAMKYFIQTQDWSHKEGVELFHFSSFDESWKVRVEGELGARWGIWSKDEKLKYR
ncbi:putative sugar transporter [Winogradskyella psychrotolerans RS-3]|uniref:Endo-1,3-beta-glucanase btgC n=1 Tax=Winogradskyella psychrotolerans RS-3 TaxID=641526 RepID=S7VPF4_9FLAO|nr:MFS transporter [Winogradskyella psychrotolerans]EPR71207.1 putative sugar transporter [Winogradskyella psychrotolerans RS-3]